MYVIYMMKGIGYGEANLEFKNISHVHTLNKDMDMAGIYSMSGILSWLQLANNCCLSIRW